LSTCGVKKEIKLNFVHR